MKSASLCTSPSPVPLWEGLGEPLSCGYPVSHSESGEVGYATSNPKIQRALISRREPTPAGEVETFRLFAWWELTFLQDFPGLGTSSGCYEFPREAAGSGIPQSLQQQESTACSEPASQLFCSAQF